MEDCSLQFLDMRNKQMTATPVLDAPATDLSPLSISGNRILNSKYMHTVDQTIEHQNIATPAEMHRQGTCLVHINAGCGFPTMTIPPRRSGFIPTRPREVF